MHHSRTLSLSLNARISIDHNDRVRAFGNMRAYQPLLSILVSGSKKWLTKTNESHFLL